MNVTLLKKSNYNDRIVLNIRWVTIIKLYCLPPKKPFYPPPVFWAYNNLIIVTHVDSELFCCCNFNFLREWRTIKHLILMKLFTNIRCNIIHYYAILELQLLIYTESPKNWRYNITKILYQLLNEDNILLLYCMYIFLLSKS